MIATVNPATGKTLRTFEELRDKEIDAKLALAAAAFQRHRLTSFRQRAERMLRAGEILTSESERWGRLMVEEMGKPIKAAIAEAQKCATACRHFAEHAEGYLRDEIADTPPDQSLGRFVPIGPVLAIMPWNFPFWQVIRFAAPALMAGNVGVLKHASNVPQCALAIEEIFIRAGFERGVFQSLLIGSAK